MKNNNNQATSIKFEQIKKSYNNRIVVNLPRWTIAENQIHCLLGPNGAGKTTSFLMLCGLVTPDQGDIFVCGNSIKLNPLTAKQSLGLIPDRPYLYEKLTGQEFINFMASLYSLNQLEYAEKCNHYLNLFQLENKINDFIETYSHGMKQKLCLTVQFARNPKLMIIDEPMVGLDPKNSALLKELFKTQARIPGRTVLISTHQLSIVEEIADTFTIINRGIMLFSGTKSDFRQKYSQNDSETLEQIFIRLTAETSSGFQTLS